jgi:predicted ATPase
MIKRIYIQNYKSIREIDLKLTPINVLIGSNGVGKSNFIGFFKLLNNLYEKNLQNYVAKQAGADNILHFGLKNSTFLKCEIQFGEKDDTRNRYIFNLVPNEYGSLIIDSETVGFHENNMHWKDSTYQTNDKEVRSLTDFQGYRYEYTRAYFNSFQIYHFHDTSNTSKIKQKGNINDNKKLREDGSNLAAFLYFLQEKHPKYFAKIETSIKSIAPYFKNFDLAPDRINPNIISLEWKENGYPDMYLNASHFSDGTLRFIALATLLLQPELPKTIIIDEPELGLHPFAINKLAALIQKASAQSQVIISTQSVNLIDNFEPEDIITVDRKENQSVFERQSSENLKDWLENYTMSDLWNKNVIGGRP